MYQQLALKALRGRTKLEITQFSLLKNNTRQLIKIHHWYHCFNNLKIHRVNIHTLNILPRKANKVLTTMKIIKINFILLILFYQNTSRQLELYHLYLKTMTSTIKACNMNNMKNLKTINMITILIKDFKPQRSEWRIHQMLYDIWKESNNVCLLKQIVLQAILLHNKV